ncbi:hypothetical protein ColKHC_01791 [Colletotrichum higginsianum]|nr:hypothetical protein ColKHC_01791 [Colletotrichum higginsianum]
MSRLSTVDCDPVISHKSKLELPDVHLEVVADVGTAGGGADAGDARVQTQQRRVLLDEVARVRGLLHRLGRVVADLEAELAPLLVGPDGGVGRRGAEAAAVALGQLDVARLEVVAALLRHLVVLVQLRHRGAEDAEPLAGLLVRVRLAGAEGEVLDVAERLGEAQVQAHARDVRGLDATGLQVDGDGEPAGGVNGVGGGGLPPPIEDARRQVRLGDDLDLVGRLGDVERAQLAVEDVDAEADPVRRVVGVVVVRGRAPEVGDDGRAGGGVLLEEGDAAGGPGGDVAAGRVEGDGEVGARDGGPGAGPLDLQLGGERAGEDLGSLGDARELVLNPGDLVGGLGPVGGVLESKGHGEIDLLVRLDAREGRGEVDLDGFASGDLGDLEGSGGEESGAVFITQTSLVSISVLELFSKEGNGVVDADKVVLVLDDKLVALDGQLERLVGLLQLDQAGRGVVGAVEQAVHDKGAIVRTLAKVAAVGVVSLAVGLLLPDAVVRPLPDVASLETGVLLKDLDVVVEAAGAVAHGVAVLAEDDGLVEAAVLFDALGLDQVAQTADGGVHVRVHVRRLGLDVALVVDGAARVEVAGVLVHGLVVVAVKGLVAERPHDDARVVLVPLHQLHHAVEVGLAPLGALAGVLAGQREGHGLALLVVGRLVDVLRTRDGVVEAVALEVGLVHDPQAELVGELKEARVGRIVRAPQRVDVVVLHDEQVALGVLEGHGAAELGVVLVSVDAPDADGHAVDRDEAVLELHLAEADVLVDRVRAERDVDAVEVGGLGRPLVGVRDGDAEVDLAVVGADLDLLAGDDGAAVLAELAEGELDGALLGGLDVDGREESGVLVLVVQVGAEEPVLNSGGRGDGEEGDVTEDTCCSTG